MYLAPKWMFLSFCDFAVHANYIRKKISRRFVSSPARHNPTFHLAAAVRYLDLDVPAM
jgi:hypothetical protein